MMVKCNLQFMNMKTKKVKKVTQSTLVKYNFNTIS
ncbi:hypothetical protein PP915_gp03 [Staphylococcus phage JPL-50]|uniref:Uncharacterized protein n=1 Tax=Staphylococcus phage JPL-50 TaxID=2851077 RepID=A0A8F3HMM9_9CAUD|nr:hypothetical protein PP915_gp03 [Staphylococcus phage JPL-50]QWY14486.1 hypothetical protein [Staphylococcus phage JPL-50]